MATAWERPATLATFGAALRARREALNLTLDTLAAATGISKPYLSNIETARAPGPPSEEKLRKLAKALNVPQASLLMAADWLRAPVSIRKALTVASPGMETSGESAGGEMPRRADGTINLDALVGTGSGRGESAARPVQAIQQNPGTVPLRAVPLINRVAAGQAAEFTDLNYPAGIADQYVPAPDLPDAPIATSFALRVIGDSMMPEYREGEIVIVGPAEPRDGDDCVVRLGEMEQFATTFKRVFFERDAEGSATAVRLVPLNREFAERVVVMEDVSGIYPLLYRLVPAKRNEEPAKPDPDTEPHSFTSRVSIEND